MDADSPKPKLQNEANFQPMVGWNGPSLARRPSLVSIDPWLDGTIRRGYRAGIDRGPWRRPVCAGSAMASGSVPSSRIPPVFPPGVATVEADRRRGVLPRPALGSGLGWCRGFEAPRGRGLLRGGQDQDDARPVRPRKPGRPPPRTGPRSARASASRGSPSCSTCRSRGGYRRGPFESDASRPGGAASVAAGRWPKPFKGTGVASPSRSR
jgi:hypothetical protein